MQGFCERFLRFVAGEIADPEEWGGCSCQNRGSQPHTVMPVEDGVRAVETDSRLEPFRPTIRITAS